MKKTTAVALIVLLAATMLFSACDLLAEPFPEETYIDTFICYPDTEKDSNIHIEPDGTEAVTETDTPTAPADPHAGLSEEERHIREVADAALLEAYELPSWENFRIEISYGANGNTNIYVRYKLTLFGYYTNESYCVTLRADKTVKDLYGSSEGEYSRYLATLTEEAFRAAEAVIGNGGYLTIDSEGWLCLSREDIVSITPETDADGNEIWEGCGDHKHVFTHERICKPES
jgi:hypothetical protein